MSAHQTTRLQLMMNSVDTCLIVTVAWLAEPSDTLAGSVPKVIFTLSPSSSTVSAVAAKSKVLDVSPASKVTLAGIRERLAEESELGEGRR